MNRLWTSLLVLALSVGVAFGQNAPSANPPIGTAGAYNAVPQTCTSGQACWLQTDANGNLKVTGGTAGSTTLAPSGASGDALTSTTCGSAVSSCVLKASAGNLYGVYAECTSACWLMVFNATSAPVNGPTTAGSASGNLVECIDVSAGSSKSLTYPIFPRAFSVGITVAISSTACATLTLSTVGFVSGGVL